MTLLEAAIIHVGRGLPVLPVLIKHTGGDGHGAWSKVPLNTSPEAGKGGARGASLNLDTVRAWWGRNPAASIGIACGWALEGGGYLLVIDDDGALKEAEAALGPLPPSVRVETPSGGWHVYLRTPAPLGNGKGKLKAWQALDVRGHGGFVVAPPSVRPDGACWRGKIDVARIAWLPDAWLAGIAPAAEPERPAYTPPPRSADGYTRERGYAEGALRGACQRVAAASEGTRHAAARNEAITLAGWLWTGLDRGVVERELCAAAVVAGKPDGERRTVMDGLAYGEARPRPVPEPSQHEARPPRTHAPPPRPPAPEAPERQPAPDSGGGTAVLDRLAEARAMCARTLTALSAQQTTREERRVVSAELAGSVDLVMAIPKAERETWLMGVDATGGMSETVRNLRRAIRAHVEGEADAVKAARRAVPASDRWRAALARTEEGKVRADYSNLYTILKNDSRYSTLRMSDLGNAVELAGDELDEGPATGECCEYLRDEYEIGATAPAVKDAIYAVAGSRRYSPVREYLERVRPLRKNRPPTLIDSILPEILGVTNPTKMQQDMVRRFLIGAVARAMHPGCKLDTALVFVGRQGAKKSTFFRVMFGEFFGDSPIPIGNKDAPMQLGRVWGYEASELEDLTSKRTAEGVKQFMATASDLYRPPFARAAVLVPRHTVLCGSANPSALLTDPTGSRRFWILTIPPQWVIPVALLRSMRDRLWSEALELYGDGSQGEGSDPTPEAGEPWWFDRDEDDVREEDAQQYQVEDDWQPIIVRWLSTSPDEGMQTMTPRRPPGEVGNFTRAAVLAGIGLTTNQMDRKSSVRAASILVRLGWIELNGPAGFRDSRVWRRAIKTES